MEIRKIIFVIAVFILGFMTAFFANSFIYPSLEYPLTSFTIGEASAPSDFIEEDKIEVYQDKVIIMIEDASLSSYASTGSMIPIFDTGANGIRIVPKSPDEIEIGDIITFEKDSLLIVHRVIEKSTDNEGIYFITRGDNNFYTDGKIRFADIKYKTIGILY